MQGFFLSLTQNLTLDFEESTPVWTTQAHR